MDPTDSCVRVMVVSPFLNNEQASSRAKIAKAERDYIMQPEKIRKMIEFWKVAENSVMAFVELNEEVIA